MAMIEDDHVAGPVGACSLNTDIIAALPWEQNTQFAPASSLLPFFWRDTGRRWVPFLGVQVCFQATVLPAFGAAEEGQSAFPFQLVPPRTVQGLSVSEKVQAHATLTVAKRELPVGDVVSHSRKIRKIPQNVTPLTHSSPSGGLALESPQKYSRDAVIAG